MNVTYLKDEELQMISGGLTGQTGGGAGDVIIPLGKSGYNLVIDFVPFSRPPLGAIQLVANKRVEIFLEKPAVQPPPPPN